MSTTVRVAQPGDEADLVDMIGELAAFEGAADECTVTATALAAGLFGDPPTVWAHVVEVDGAVAGCAVWYRTFSTWDGVAGIYLEDLFVRPAFRRLGLARTLLAALAAECTARGFTRLEWAVLDWNANAIALYDAVGGVPQNEWIHYRVSGPALSELAGSSESGPTGDGATSH